MSLSKQWSFGLVVAVMSLNVWATILPKNNLHLQDRRTGFVSGGVTEEQFNKISDYVISLWAPIAKKHGATLSVNKKWNDSTVNAYAYQTSGNRWFIDMYGGMARRPEMTPDAFAMIACHELGHHFAGYVFYANGETLSSEGQADYWAAHVCAKRVFSEAMKNQTAFLPPPQAPRYVLQRCSNLYKADKDKLICVRTALASKALADLLAVLEKSPPTKFEIQDKSQVQKTFVSHPAAQCRLDTYMAGAACTAPFDLNVIPGKGARGGENSAAVEAATSKYFCTNTKTQAYAVRPGCWFASLAPGQPMRPVVIAKQ